MRTFFRTLLGIILLAGVVSGLLPVAHADESFQTDYSVDYYLGNEGATIATSVKLTTTITNKEDNVYLDKYSIAFPKSFEMNNIKATSDNGSVDATIDTGSQNTTVLMKIKDAAIGVGKTTRLYLSFDQANLFQVNGNVWEVLLPTMQKAQADGGSYTIRVHLPPNDKRLSIAKPKPDTISTDTITWVNPEAKTIIAVFGDRQVYNLKLRYHIQNDRLVPVVTDIAFPPNTTYQQITTSQIAPEPESVSLDTDGNYLGRYHLNPHEQKTILFEGQALVYAKPLDDQIERDRVTVQAQRSYSTKSTHYWNATVTKGEFASPKDVYDNLVSRFQYNYDRVSDPNAKRLGAATALSNPTNAVCAEFTDSFVSLTRSLGIPSRELNGFGFSQDERLRPQSLDGDVLHAWPEYWDDTANMWKQVDPTWENTSGIDYFDSFDLNHIVFAIHSKEDDYPVPAGMYKTSKSQDVTVEPTATVTKRFTDITVSAIDVPKILSDQKSASGIAHIKNQGNTFAYDVKLKSASNDLRIALAQETISVIAPYQTVDIPFTLTSKTTHSDDLNTTIAITANTNKATADVTIRSYQKLLLYAGGIGILILFGIISSILAVVKRQKKPREVPPPEQSPIRPL